MKHLIVNGDAGFRKDALIEVDGEEYVAFQVNRQGEWHGPDEPQLWCIVGKESERQAYVEREYTPHFLDVHRVDADAVTVTKQGSELNV